MGARTHCLHILFISFEKSVKFEAAIEKSQKNVEFSFQNFQGFLLLSRGWGAELGLPGHLALLALVEAWRSRGAEWQKGGPSTRSQRGPLSPDGCSCFFACSDCPHRSTLCCVVYFFFFPLTLNKKCDRAGGLFSSPSGDRAGVRRKGGERTWELTQSGNLGILLRAEVLVPGYREQKPLKLVHSKG